MAEDTKKKLNRLAKRRTEVPKELDKANTLKKKYKVLRDFGKDKKRIMQGG